MRNREDAGVVRGIVARAVLEATNDNGGSQTADVTVFKDVRRSGVEILQPFGVASRAPAGGLALVFAIGGDQGDMVALMPGAPEHRFGGLAEGEVAIYTAEGDFFHLRADGSATVKTSKSVDVEVGGTGKMTLDASSFRVEVPGGLLTMDGSGLRHNGKNIGDTHVHGEVTPGSADTGVPSN